MDRTIRQLEWTHKWTFLIFKKGRDQLPLDVDLLIKKNANPHIPHDQSVRTMVGYQPVKWEWKGPRKQCLTSEQEKQAGWPSFRECLRGVSPLDAFIAMEVQELVKKSWWDYQFRHRCLPSPTQFYATSTETLRLSTISLRGAWTLHLKRCRQT